MPALELIDLAEPNLRADARAAALADFSRGWGPGGEAATAAASPPRREWVLLREDGPLSPHHFGWRSATGVAASRGAPGRSLRRPSSGSLGRRVPSRCPGRHVHDVSETRPVRLLGRYALRKRRHNAATAIEPELGLLLLAAASPTPPDRSRASLLP